MTQTILARRPRHPLFRTTFVRGRIEPQLTTLDEVLAVKLLAGDLKRKLNRELTADERRLLLDDFFGRQESDRWLYLPLALRPQPGDQPILPTDYLTCLSDYLTRAPRGAPGVLLAARSGAGKTMAGIKAFRDCVVRPRDTHRPPLADRLPVRLRLSGLSAAAETLTNLRSESDRDPPAARCHAGQVDSPRIVEELLLDAAGLAAPLESLRYWLRFGPPLLLFLDLNTADNDAVRLAVARSLCRFQEDYARFGHRCIVAYRSTESHDDAMTALREREGALFRTFDLVPIDAANAVAYLRHLRVFESDVYAHFDLTPPRRDVERECRTLEEFVQRYAASRESLISTPLIMELVATLRPGDVETIRSLADLYERVTAALLKQQGLISENDQDRAITAMVRLALAILAHSPTATRLEGRRRFLDLLEHPDYGRRGEHGWHPAGQFWLGPPDAPCPYYSGAIRPAERYREHALFAASDESIGFLHDSFVYYFAAYALRYHDGRDRPPADVGIEPDAWPREAAARILPRLASWEQPLEFLGGMLPPEEVRKLTMPLLTVEPRPEMARVLGRLLRGRRSREQEGDDPVLRQLERAVLSRLTEVARYPEALFPHVYNHLSWCEEPQATCHTFADGVLRPAMNETGRPWLRAETPMPPLAEQVFRCDSEPFCLAIFSPGEFVTGHLDGTVRRWASERGQNEILYQHDGAVTSVAVNVWNGMVLSGEHDGTVRCWLPGWKDATVLYHHDYGVYSVAVDTRYGGVVSGGYDGMVFRWEPGWRNAAFLYRHEDIVTSVAVDGRDGAVVSGGHDGTVFRWEPGREGAVVVHRHELWVHFLAVDGRDGAVVSGGRDAIHRWEPGREAFTIVHQHRDRVTSVAVDVRSGAVVWGERDGSVRRWLPERGDAILYRHEGWVHSVAVDGRDGSVVSGGDDGTVRRWEPGRDDAALYQDADKVVSLAVDGRDGAVVSGGRDGMVRRWLPAPDDAILYRHEGWVHSVAVDGRDGSVVSGGDDGTVRRWEPGREDAILYRHLYLVTSVAVGAWDGTVASAGDDGTVRRWAPGEKGATVLHRHEHYWVHSVAVSGRDGAVVSGGHDCTVLRWEPGRKETVVLHRHGNGVQSVVGDARDGAVVSGRDDGTVHRWMPGQAGAAVLYRHTGAVRSMAMDDFSDSLFSGGGDANLRLFRLALRDFLMLLTPYSIRSIACSLRHNRIALALGDGRVVLVRVEPSVEALLQWRAHPSQGGQPTSEPAQQ